MPDLTPKQQELFDQLYIAIIGKQDITGLLEGMSKDEFLDIFKDKSHGSTLFRTAAYNKNQKAMQDILSMAENKKVLGEFVEDVLGMLNSKYTDNVLNTIKKGCGLEAFLKKVIRENDRKTVINKLNKNASDEAMKVGVALGVIAPLVVGGGCFAAGVQLPILALIGIAAALVVGLAAYGITYAVLKPSNELEKINIRQNQETELQDMNNGRSSSPV